MNWKCYINLTLGHTYRSAHVVASVAAHRPLPERSRARLVFEILGILLADVVDIGKRHRLRDGLRLVPGGSVRGERANFTRLGLGCIEAKFCE